MKHSLGISNIRRSLHKVSLRRIGSFAAIGIATAFIPQTVSAQLKVSPQNSGHAYSLRHSGNLYQFEVRPGDGDAAKKTRGITDRSEIRFTRPTGTSGLVAPRGTASWFSFSFAPQFNRPSKKWVSIFQFVPPRDAADKAPKSPPLAIELHGRNLKVVTRTDPNRVTRKKAKYTVRGEARNLTIAKLDEAPIFYDIVGRVVFGWNNDAELRLWLNGYPLVNITGANIGYNDPANPYPKAGIYRAATNTTMRLALVNPEITTDGRQLYTRVRQPMAVPYSIQW